MTEGQADRLVGVTGHQGLAGETEHLVEDAIRQALSGLHHVTGITSLAGGADQVFARVVLRAGGRIIALLPSENYERSFESQSDLLAFRDLLSKADEILTMHFDEPSEEAYLAAGQEMVNRVDQLLAVWDGQPAAGVGGTADIVQYAREKGKPVHVIWPQGARRN